MVWGIVYYEQIINSDEISLEQLNEYCIYITPTLHYCHKIFSINLLPGDAREGIGGLSFHLE